MWPSSYWPTAQWTGSYWPPGGVPVVIPPPTEIELVLAGSLSAAELDSVYNAALASLAEAVLAETLTQSTVAGSRHDADVIESDKLGLPGSVTVSEIESEYGEDLSGSISTEAADE